MVSSVGDNGGSTLDFLDMMKVKQAVGNAFKNRRDLGVRINFVVTFYSFLSPSEALHRSSVSTEPRLQPQRHCTMLEHLFSKTLENPL